MRYRGYSPPRWPFRANWEHPWLHKMVHLGIHNGFEWVNVVDGYHSKTPPARDGVLVQTPHGTGFEWVSGDQTGVRWEARSTYDISPAISFGGYQSSAGLLNDDGGIITASQGGYFNVTTKKTYELGVLNNVLWGQLSDNTNNHGHNQLNGVDADLVAGLDNFRGAMFTWDGVPNSNSVSRAHEREGFEAVTQITSIAPADQNLQMWGGEDTDEGPDYEWVGRGLFGFVMARYMPLEEREWFASDEILAYEWLEPYGRRQYIFLFPPEVPDEPEEPEPGEVTDVYPTYDGIHLRASTGGGAGGEACSPCSSNRELSGLTNSLINGGSNAVGEITLDASASGGSRIFDRRAGTDTVVAFMPLTAEAAAELYSGNMWISERVGGAFTITHSAATSTRSYGYALFGTGRAH